MVLMWEAEEVKKLNRWYVKSYCCIAVPSDGRDKQKFK